MGLLSRATTNTAPQDQSGETGNDAINGPASFNDEMLDDMGKALSERIGRLPHNTTTPYTALSLLKAYGSFQSGLCLTLKDGVYSSYTSVGMGVDKISIPQGKIWSEENSHARYFKNEAGDKLGIHTSHDNFCYWIFPLDSSVEESSAEKFSGPWEDVMILGVPDHAEANSAFNPEAIAAIIPYISDKLVLRISHNVSEPAVDSDSVEQSSPEFVSDEADTLKEKITEYYQIYTNFNCIVLDIPDSTGDEERAGFHKTVSKMLNMTGTVLPLPAGHPLILLPKLLDRELIAQRLAKSLNTKLLESFEADSPENVYNKIKSLL